MKNIRLRHTFLIYSSFEFTFKKTSLDNVWGFRLLRWFLDTRPAAENTLSALAEPLGMLKTVRATLARRGYDLEFSFQNCMTSASGFCLGDEKNFSTSPLASPGVRNCSLKYEPNSRALLVQIQSQVRCRCPVSHGEDLVAQFPPQGGRGSPQACCTQTHHELPIQFWNVDPILMLKVYAYRYNICRNEMRCCWPMFHRRQQSSWAGQHH